MIKLLLGTTLVLLFIYCLHLVYKMSRVAAKQKELVNIAIDEELQRIDEEIVERKKRLLKGNDENGHTETSTTTTTTTKSNGE